jgi:exonuclease III
LSMNVRGLFSNSKKRADVFDWAKSKDASIVCFQETHSNKNIEKYCHLELRMCHLHTDSLMFHHH